MRIAFHVPRASQLNPGASGDRVLVAAIRDGLRERGHQVGVVTPSNVRRYWRGERHPALLGLDAARVAARAATLRPDAWLVYGASTVNPDLFGWWMRPNRYVLYSTDLGSGSRLPQRWRGALTSAHRRSLRRADAVAAYHPRSADHLGEAGVPPDRLHVLVPAARVPRRVEDRTVARGRLRLPDDAPIAVTVARLAPGDKTEMAARAVEVIAHTSGDVRLVVVGDGPGRQAVARAAAERGVEARVDLVGAVAHDEVSAYLAAADVFLYPHPTDRPWLAVLEAQAHGRPVVVAASRSARLTVEEGRTGLLGTETAELAAHLTSLLDDAERREAMGRRARAYVEERHSLERRLDDIEALLGARVTPARAPATRPA